MANYYISLAGNDITGNGTLANPWQTISKAVSMIAANDTIYCIASGGNLVFGNQTFTVNCTIAGYGGTAVLDGGGGNVKWLLNGANLATFTLTDLKFQNIDSTDGGTGVINTSNAARGASLFTVTLTRCTFQSVHSNYALIGSAIDSITPSVVMTDCLVNDFHSLLAPNLPAVISLYGNDVTGTLTATNTTIYFSTTPGANQAIIRQGGTGTVTATVKNCIVANFSGGTVSWANGTPTTTCTYSDNYLITSAPAGTGNITSDPLLVDAPNANFNLRPTSPCIGTGSL